MKSRKWDRGASISAGEGPSKKKKGGYQGSREIVIRGVAYKRFSGGQGCLSSKPKWRKVVERNNERVRESDWGEETIGGWGEKSSRVWAKLIWRGLKA